MIKNYTFILNLTLNSINNLFFSKTTRIIIKITLFKCKLHNASNIKTAEEGEINNLKKFFDENRRVENNNDLIESMIRGLNNENLYLK